MVDSLDLDALANYLAPFSRTPHAATPGSSAVPRSGLVAAGVPIRHHRRDNSKGFKAGALVEGCAPTSSMAASPT